MPALKYDIYITVRAGGQRDACVACAQKTLGIHKTMPLQVKVRERDMRTDWGTVK